MGVSDNEGERQRPSEQPDGSDTEPIRPVPPSYPPSSPPSGHEEPQPSGAQPPPSPAPYPWGYQPPGAQPAGQPAGTAWPAPVGQSSGQSSGQASSGSARLPGWAWPVITVLALVVGALGGVLAAVAVSLSMDSGNGSSVPAISADNGASAPLSADNGSVAAVAERVLPSTVQIQANGGADGNTRGGATGSGFVLDAKGHVITNNHVVADATGKGELKVLTRSGKKLAATIVGRSPVYDLAVLDVPGAKALRPAAIGSARTLRVGDTVVAIGSPLGLSSTVTSGIVSATNRPVTTGSASQAASSFIDALQTDAAINPGNSGGPLSNLRGQVVGVNSAIATTGGSVGGESGNIGVGFAIPMEQVRVTAAQILATGKAHYPVIGADVNTNPAASGKTVVGAQVLRVPSGSPAAAGGLRKGDVVTNVNGKNVTTGIGLIVAIRSHQPGETVKLRIQRDGTSRTVRVRLQSKVG